MRRRAVTFTLAFLFWGLLGLVFAAQTYLSAAVLSEPISWRHAFAYSVPGWYVWAALAPLVALLGRTVPIARDRIIFGVIFHLTASALFALVHTMVAVAFMFVTMPDVMGSSYLASLRVHLRLGSHLNLLTYWAILGVSYAARYYRDAQQRELKATQLAAGLAQARLDALRMELNPHFLFNTLNTVASLVYSNPRGADQMIAQLGELLRITLETRDRNEVSLEEEIRYLRSYVSIEQVRFEGRLKVQFDIPDDAARAQVPGLLLQPLVENAIRHGIASSAVGGSVEVRARRENGTLTLVVADSGGGSAHTGGLGIGLANTRARLEHSYGPAQTLNIRTDAERGTTIEITIPYTQETE